MLKPYIGTNPRLIKPGEITRVARLNHAICAAVVVDIVGWLWWRDSKAEAS